MTTVDGLLFLGTSHFGYQLDASTALAGMDEVGSSVAIAAPMHPHRGGFAVANDAVAEVARKSDGRLIPLCRVDPWEGEAAVAELRRAVREGARGLFLHPSEERFRINDLRVRPLFETAAELAVPVMVAAGYHLFAEPLQLGAAARWIPDHPVVLTNGGQFNISGMSQFDAELTLGGSANVHVQTSGMYREDFLEGVVAKFGPERLLFATAAPIFTMAYERLRVDLAHFSDTETELILGGNTVRIFGEVTR